MSPLIKIEGPGGPGGPSLPEMNNTIESNYSDAFIRHFPPEVDSCYHTFIKSVLAV